MHRLLDESGQTRFLKIVRAGWTPSADAEAERTMWAQAFLPVPRILQRGATRASSWFVSDGMRGLDATNTIYRDDVHGLVRRLAHGLRRFHEIPVLRCPFQFRVADAIRHVATRLERGALDPREFHSEFATLTAQSAVDELIASAPESEDLVVCHGDYCAPNILLHNDAVTGYVDLGELGVADRWWDLAVATWSVTWNFGPALEPLFLEAYGIEPDEKRMRFYRLLYDLASQKEREPEARVELPDVRSSDNIYQLSNVPGDVRSYRRIQKEAGRLLMALTVAEQLQVLLAEYDKMNAEMRMYVEQYYPKFTAFGTLIVAAFTFAFEKQGFEVVFVIIPYFLFVVLHVTLGQAYMISIVGAKIRELEARFKDMNAGRGIADWETRYARQLVYPALLRIGRTRRVAIPNPLFASVIFIAIAVFPLLGYSIWKGYVFLDATFPAWHAGVWYAILTVVLFLGIVVQAFSFFAVGGQVERLLTDSSAPALEMPMTTVISSPVAKAQHGAPSPHGAQEVLPDAPVIDAEDGPAISSA